MLDQVYLNGAFLPAAEARLHVSDLSILRGFGVFDYFRVIGGKPRFAEDHLARFRMSAGGLGMSLPLGKQELLEAVQEVIDRNGPAAGGIRTILTGGYSEDGYTPTSPNLLILPYAYKSPAAELYSRGCAVMLHPYERQLPQVKSIDYLEGIRIQPLLKERGAQYPLYVDRDGNVRESDRSNFMIVRGGRLITPAEDILLGITRKHLLRLAGQLGIPVEERAVSVEELRKADEALICSSIKGAMPITQVDGRPVGGGDAGAVTTRLMQGWKEYA